MASTSTPSSDSFVTQSVVTNNDDGILLTDDYGPNYGNYIADNYVADNIYECGIVMPSHNPFAVAYTQNPDQTYSTGVLTPASGGVFDNWVYDNEVIDNGPSSSRPLAAAARASACSRRRRRRLVRQHGDQELHRR